MRIVIFALLLLIGPMAGAVEICDTVRLSEFYGEIGPDGNATVAIREALDACRKRKAKVLAFEQKRYDIWPEGAARREWFISNTSSEKECPSKIKIIGVLIDGFDGLTVDGNGADLVFHGKMTTFAVSNSSDITIKDLSVDFERPTMSEMTFSYVCPDYSDVVFHHDSRYKINQEGQISLIGEGWRYNIFHCVEYNPKNEHLAYSNIWKSLNSSKADEVGERRVRFYVPNLNASEGLKLTVRDIIRDQVGMFFNESSNVTLSGIKTYYMHGLGIVSQRVRNITIKNVSCAPRNGSGRIMASSADFMHFSGCGGKITITDCYFSGAHDDCVNIHGTNLKIVNRINDRKVVLRFMHPQSYGFKAFSKNDTVAFVRSSNMTRYAESIVKKVKRISDREIELQLDRDLPADVIVGSDCVENMTWTPEVEIRGCNFTHTNTRGTLVTTPRKVIISDNVYRKTGMSAILIEGDAQGWFESGPVCDVTIKNNRFIDCGYLGGPKNAVITINPSNNDVDENFPVHENVTITNNNFETFGNPVVYAKSTSPISIEDNISVVTYPNISKSEHIGQPFIFEGCKDVNVSGNIIEGYSLKDRLTATKTLWFDRPAKIWQETLPLGDGRLGMMPDGGISQEKIVLNDITMWSGSEYDYSNPEAAKYLPEIRRLLLEGENAEAQKMMYEHFVPKKPEMGGTYGSYQILGDLSINYKYPDTIIWPEDYIRLLDLGSGISETEFTLSDGTVYKRIYAVPRGQNGMLIRLSASKPGAISFSYHLSRNERGAVSSLDNLRLMLSGELDSGQPGVQGLRYAVTSGVKVDGEKARLSMQGDSAIVVSNADAVWIGISAATTYLCGDAYVLAAERMLDNVLQDPSKAIVEGIKVHNELMSRAEISCPPNDNSLMPTPQRLHKFQTDDSDAALVALYYNYGRYLLISSTRQDLLPPNLQGLWANTLLTPWNGDYHTNINVQMNHWPAEQGNLPELVQPLINLVRRAVPSGERTAKAFYGPDAEGWVMHMMTNVWNYTEPGEHPSWGATNTGGAWLCRHLWEHYEYTGDKEYLRSVYPIMKGSARFFYTTMIEEPEHGWLVTAPSSSPENKFYSPEGEAVSVCMGPTMDTQLIGELWSNVVKANDILRFNDTFVDSLEVFLQKLPPMQIDSEGRLMEWLKEYPEEDRHHRHVSHLYGLYPGESISYHTTPELAQAASKSLDARGDEGTGWSRAWKINFHARLHDGDRAWRVLRGLLQPAITEKTSRHRAGTFPNLLCSHPPFQIDGNFGGTAGIGEMLIQSHEGFIELLPALPTALPTGMLRGFKTRGGAEIDLEWKDNQPTKLTVRGGYEPEIKIRYAGCINVLNLQPGEETIILFN